MSKQFAIPKGTKTLGEAIRVLREDQGMTLRALAEKVGVSAPFLSDIEHGRRQTDKIINFAVALNVNPEDLKAFDSRIPSDLKDWLAENPKLVGFLKDMQHSGNPVPLEALQSIINKKR
ncbi:MAG: helix-turn-helix domain-containing protein [Pseudobdellovibrionaceae bacterium]